MSYPSTPRWEPGFDSERKLVVARLGFWQWSLPLTTGYVQRFYHRVLPLPIEDWSLEFADQTLGSWCTLKTRLDIRFQPTCRYAARHLMLGENFAGMIRQEQRPLLQDLVTQTLASLPPDIWLSDSYADIEACLEALVQNALAVKQIQSRCLCRLSFIFSPESLQSAETAVTDFRYQAVIKQLGHRLHELRLSEARACLERTGDEMRQRIEHQEKMTEWLQLETCALQKRKEQETLKIREEMAIREALEREQQESESRLRLEQIRQETHIRHVQLETEMEEKNQRAQAMNDVEQHLHREIEFLTLERQRLLLEDEIQTFKQARIRGWNGNNRPRLAE